MESSLKHLLTTLLVSAALMTGPACAAGPTNGNPPPQGGQNGQPAPAPGLGLPFSNFLSDDEMGMLFDYLRDSFIATMRNDPEGASMPPELAFKLEVMKQRMLKEGDAYVRQLMQSMQQELDRSLKEYNQQLPQHPLPPAPPVQPQPAPGTPSRT